MSYLLYKTIIVPKKVQVIFKNNLNNKALLVGSRSNCFWKDSKKFKEGKSYPKLSGFFLKRFILKWLIVDHCLILKRILVPFPILLSISQSQSCALQTWLT